MSVAMEPHVVQRLLLQIPVDLLQHKLIASSAQHLHCATDVWCDEDARRLDMAVNVLDSEVDS